jgi:hypothetical protein
MTPKIAGNITAAIWFIVKLILEVAAMSSGAAIFWK